MNELTVHHLLAYGIAALLFVLVTYWIMYGAILSYIWATSKLPCFKPKIRKGSSRKRGSA